MVVDPLHRYSNEQEKNNLDIYDNYFKFKKRFGLHGLYRNTTAL